MRFGILGPLEVVDGDRQLVVRGAKERAVLSFLLLHAGRVVSADRLVDQLWGEEPPESARKSLRVRVTGLRKVLGVDGIVTRPSGYLVQPERDELDLDRFERLVAESGEAEPALSADLLEEALDLWRGPPLADFSAESWAQGPISRLEELRLVALEKRVDADLALGRAAQIIGELRALVADHPLRERLQAQLMLALYRSGRQAEALAVYRRARGILVEELGIEPGGALSDLEAAILRQDPSLELTRPDMPKRAILVAALADESENRLLRLATPLASRPLRELIVLRPNVARIDLTRTSAALQQRRVQLVAAGQPTRVAAFASSDVGRDTVRAAAEQDVDLLLLDGPLDPLDDPIVSVLIASAPCDVAILVGGEPRAGAVLVPFVGAEHDWSAVELGAWLARALGVSLRLVGPEDGQRDASRLLADASLAVQRALGVPAEPLLVEPGPDALLGAVQRAGIVLLGLSDRWRSEGLGPVRAALVNDVRTPVLLVRRGLRPGGLAPPESYTRFTWTIRPEA